MNLSGSVAVQSSQKTAFDDVLSVPPVPRAPRARVDFLRGFGKEGKDVPSHTEQLGLLMKAQQGDQQAAKEFVLRNVGLAVSIARQFHHAHGAGAALEDLVMAGFSGLASVAKTFQPRYGFTTSYVARVLMTHISGEQRLGPTIKIAARHVLPTLLSALEIQSEHQSAGEAVPDLISILTDYLGVSPKRAKLIANLPRADLSLDFSVAGSEEGQMPLGEILPDEKQISPADVLERKSAVEVTRQLLARLSPADRLLIERRFGVSGTGESPDVEEKTLEQVAKYYGVTREAIRMRLKPIIEKLRLMLEELDLSLADKMILSLGRVMEAYADRPPIEPVGQIKLSGTGTAEGLEVKNGWVGFVVREESRVKVLPLGPKFRDLRAIKSGEFMLVMGRDLDRQDFVISAIGGGRVAQQPG